jgi:putative SOS response-associated peptidase YedK
MEYGIVERPKKAQTTGTIDEAVTAHLEELGAKVSNGSKRPETHSASRQVLREFQAYCEGKGKKSLSKITRLDLLNHAGWVHQQSPTKSRRTANTKFIGDHCLHLTARPAGRQALIGVRDPLSAFNGLLSKCEMPTRSAIIFPMCGRYRLSRRKQLVDEYFGSASGEGDWNPRYNVAPTQSVPVIRQNPKEPVRDLSLVRWGLIPSWAKDPSVGAGMINARSETAATKPAFRDALKYVGGLIPANAFYEWSGMGKGKQPYCFEVNAEELFAFAGIWDRWSGPNGNTVETCSILTTTPNAVTTTVHDRMPVILDPDSYDQWLDLGMKDVGAASELLKPYDAADEVLSREHPDQSRGERRRGMRCARGTRRGSESTLLVVGL